MKSHIFVFLLVAFPLFVDAQVSFNDIFTQGNKLINPYADHKGNFIEVVDNLLAKKYVLVSFQIVNIANGQEYVFDFENSADANEKIRIVNFDTKVGGTRTIRYTVLASTLNLDVYTGWITAARAHPEFARAIRYDDIFLQIYESRPTINEKRAFFFATPMQSPAGPSVWNVRRPVVYTVQYIRPIAGLKATDILNENLEKFMKDRF
ncbi:MAG TPA: hypothetical protein VK658_15040 [Chryseolinea sp.]|nr:hypothetical protein [Chryseolinea sp.]